MVSLLSAAAVSMLPAGDPIGADADVSPAATAGSAVSALFTPAGPLALRATMASMDVCVIPGSVRGSPVGSESRDNWLTTAVLLLFKSGDVLSLFATRPIARWLGFMLHHRRTKADVADRARHA